jgi:hypothetical protein
VGDNGIVIDGSTYYIGQVINLKVGSSIFLWQNRCRKSALGG